MTTTLYDKYGVDVTYNTSTHTVNGTYTNTTYQDSLTGSLSSSGISLTGTWGGTAIQPINYTFFHV
jgi:hypothetical protein